MPANALKQFADKVVKQAKADPRKAGVLAVLIIVLIFLWARLAGGGSSGPSSANANISQARAGSDVLENLHPGGNAASSLASLQEWARRPIVPALSRNLFIVNYDFFPQDGTKPAPVHLALGDGFWDQVAKSMTLRADQRREREVLLERLRQKASQLKVQSTVMSAKPRALINGALVGVGDVVASFRITRIEARRIVVECEGIKLELRLE